ncbi:aldo/keto reductase [Leptospira adleri]|uniref:Aldo/keto reductase n=1 Tax=Leptospira adleri TaxID=2023186 RepID=A0A2M9YL06_9LEPT|nr:aldo/keto reductase [Leptospira adleri]PJZ52235.1 aldo/keto reductase [Leptospira adleri]PJZ63179.1 aldo/keto reductase [Leptospira adleri]TGM53355.1 aldo/keto reductase [Leptospira adleri]
MTLLGTQGLKTSRLGLGCMGMSEFYGARDDSESLKTLRRAYELGITFWDTADMYGPYINEELLSLALNGIRSEITVATKFGIVRDPADPSVRGYNGTPKYVQSSCEASLKRLKIETIDLYYMHRLDPNTPIEETVGAMSRLVEQGKIRYVGLSEINSDILKRANAVHPISAVQNEYSLWSREPEDDILEACKKLGVGFVAYSPLGRGFLTGQIKKFEDFDPNDYRRMSPRFQGENFAKNLELVQKIESLAKQKECKPSQLALAWVLAQGENIVPIPGTKRIPYLEENFGALKINLTENDLKEIDSIAPKGIAKGARYPEWKKNTVS